jgi:hypothetical protein
MLGCIITPRESLIQMGVVLASASDPLNLSTPLVIPLRLRLSHLHEFLEVGKQLERMVLSVGRDAKSAERGSCVASRSAGSIAAQSGLRRVVSCASEPFVFGFCRSS